jgi:hypothetical protein
MLGRHVYRVTPAGERAWRVAKDGESAPRTTRPSRGEAIDVACNLAAADEPSKVVIESRDGTLADERVFGVDPGETLGPERDRLR